MNGRPYCRCLTVRNFNYAEAAAKLRCSQRWLEDNISRLPHQKLGASPAFCDCELALIQAIFTILPPDLPSLVLAGSGPEGLDTEHEGVPALAAIRPSGTRRSRAAL